MSRTRPLKTFPISSKALWTREELRLDASSFNPDVVEAIGRIRNSGMEARELGALVSAVFFPNRFTRVYVDAEEGVPFLQGSHVVHFRPDGLQYLSKEAHKRIMERLFIKAGWILLTRSGTVGRVTLCPAEWDGWAASEHVFRIVPNEDKCPAGYLCAFLSTRLGQLQLQANIYGAQVDELTVEHIRGILVPIPNSQEDWKLVLHVDRTFREAIAAKSQAANMVGSAIGRIAGRIPK